MKVTWLVEYKTTEGFVIYDYARTLRDAKRCALTIQDLGVASVLKLRGQYWGEGYHDYRLGYVNGAWRKVNTRTGEVRQ